jgi:hypothetical protein
MSTSVNTSEASTPITMASCPVSLADGTTMLAECKQAILHHGGTWPPAGTKTTSGRSASAATCTTKDDSGFLAKVLTASSPEELRRLCNERNRQDVLQRMSLMSSHDITANLGSKWHPISGLSKDQAIEVFRLRTERVELFEWFRDNIEASYNSWQWSKNSERLQRVNYQLMEITKLKQYLYK